MAKTATLKITGARELERWMLKELPAKLARKSTLAGMRKAAKPMVNIAKAKVAYRSGALQQAIGIRTVPMRGGSTESALGGENTFAAIDIGALSGGQGASLHAWARYLSYYGRGIRISKGGKQSTSLIGRIRHAHLVEFGFRHRSGKKVPAQPFLQPAFYAGYSSYYRTLITDIRTKVEASIRRHNSKSPARKR